MNNFLKNEAYAVTYGADNESCSKESKLAASGLVGIFQRVAKRKGFVIDSSMVWEGAGVATIRFREDVSFATMQKVLDDVQTAIGEPVFISSDTTVLGDEIMNSSQDKAANSVRKEAILKSGC